MFLLLSLTCCVSVAFWCVVFRWTVLVLHCLTVDLHSSGSVPLSFWCCFLFYCIFVVFYFFRLFKQGAYLLLFLSTVRVILEYCFLLYFEHIFSQLIIVYKLLANLILVYKSVVTFNIATIDIILLNRLHSLLQSLLLCSNYLNTAARQTEFSMFVLQIFLKYAWMYAMCKSKQSFKGL